MALLWVEGFETYGTSINVDRMSVVSRRYSASSSTALLGNSPMGGYDLASGSGGYLTTPALTTADTLIVGCRVRMKYYVTSYYTVFSLYDGTTLGIDVQINPSLGEISVYRNTTLLGTTTNARCLLDAYPYIEAKVKCNATTGTVEIRVNGNTCLSLSGINTKYGTHSYHDRVRITPGIYFNLDDWYVCDNSGTANNDFLGVQRVVALFPSGDSATVNWTPSAVGTHYSLVDEALENDDADYVSSDISGTTDLWDYQALSGIDIIKGVQVTTVCKQTDAGSFSLITPALSSAIASDDTAQLIGTQSYTARRRILEIDPATSLAWTPEGLNAAQIGVKVG